MATKDWKASGWGFSEDKMWVTFKKGNKTIWVGKRSGKYIAVIDGRKPSPKYKTQSGALKYAKAYMRKN